MVVTFRKNKASWAAAALEANSRGLGSWTAGSLRSWWHERAPESTRQRLRRQKRLREQLAELAETEPSPAEIARRLRRRGHTSLRGHRLGRAHVADMLARYEIARCSPPRRRQDCPTARPCPKVSCRYHLAIEVDGRGRMRLAPIRVWEVNRKGQAHGLPDLEAGDLGGLPETCALDIADREALHLEAIGEHLNLTRERVRQVLREGLAKVRSVEPELADRLERIYEQTKWITRSQAEVREAIASDPRRRRDGSSRREHRRKQWKRREL